MKKAAVVALNTKQGPMFDNELFPGTRMGNQLWVEPVGELVLARLRGMVALSQRTLDDTWGVLKIRRAIVVPTCKLAYLARWHLAKATTACSTTTSARPSMGLARNRLRDA